MNNSYQRKPWLVGATLILLKELQINKVIQLQQSQQEGLTISQTEKSLLVETWSAEWLEQKPFTVQLL
jgi:hypothetical protein